MLEKYSKSFIVIDGYALVFRAYYALPDLTNRDGVAIGAIHGAIKLLLAMLKDQGEGHLVVALDGAETLIREEIYSGYKANRAETPESLIGQFDIFEEALRSMGIPYCRANGYEADDLIATFAKTGKKNNMQVTVVTGDKDLMQLIDDGVRYFDAFKKKYISRDDVVEKFGVPPEMLLDYLSLVGDKVDNIPGVASIGPKTASSLISAHGGIEAIYCSLDAISSAKTRKALEENKDAAFLSKKLAALHDEIDCLPALEDLRFAGVKEESFQEFLKKYHLTNILASLSKSNSEPKAEKQRNEKGVSAGQNSFDF